MSKKVKGFNVDEDIYNSLLKIFKTYDVNVSLSSYVNDRLKEFLRGLQWIEKGLESCTMDGKKYTVPMSFIIKSMALGKGQTDYENDTFEGEEEIALFAELEEWQNDYDAQRRKIPVSFITFLRDSSDSYELSPDKKYLINKKTGEKYIAGKSRTSLIKVKE